MALHASLKYEFYSLNETPGDTAESFFLTNKCCENEIKEPAAVNVLASFLLTSKAR